MASRNDITGDSIQTKSSSQAYRDNWDLAFGKKEVKKNIMNRDDILDILHNNVATVTFTKSNGETRVLKGTLLDQYLPQKEIIEEIEFETVDEIRERKATKDNVVLVYDIENYGYRSFRIDSLVSITIVN